MSDYHVRKYEESLCDQWEKFVGQCPQATFLHTRRFLSYHQDRFADQSLMFWKGGALVAVLPAAVTLENLDVVSSHPGLTYGGLLATGRTNAAEVRAILESAIVEYWNTGFRKLIYKAIPSIYHRFPYEADVYSLWALGATVSRIDLSSVINLENRGDRGSRRKRAYRKAVREGLVLSSTADNLEALWPVLIRNLVDSHGVKPAHVLSEISTLRARFPEKITCVCARLNEDVVGGVVFFETDIVLHAQYIAASDEGKKLGALDLIFEDAIDKFTSRGGRWFSFGTSTENAGKKLNTGLHVFKSEFGAGTSANTTLEIEFSGAKLCH